MNWLHKESGWEWESGDFKIYVDPDGLFNSQYLKATFGPKTTNLEEAKILCRWKDEKLHPPEPIPAGVWWDIKAGTYGMFIVGKEGHGTGTHFFDRWFPRRAEFPQAPPAPPETPWEQKDVPWPCLLRWDEKALHAAVGMEKDGIRVGLVGTIVGYRVLAENYQWSPDNVRWFPCTKEAVTAWRAGKQ